MCDSVFVHRVLSIPNTIQCGLTDVAYASSSYPITCLDFSPPWRFCALRPGGLYDGFAPEAFQGLDQSVRVSWRVAAASVAVLLFLAPVFYGTLWHPMRYPTIKVSMKGSQTVQCGMLILGGDSDLLLWRATAR